MRAFASGFYCNLKAMYDYLGVEYLAQSFLFSFSVAPSHNVTAPQPTRHPAYFIHSSNNHRIPPLKPEGTTVFEYVVQLVYLLLCYAWYTICCFLVPPRTHGKRGTSETFGQYLMRIRLPRHFTDYYLLPLMSAVTTCPHDTLLQFPACDLTEYKKQTYRAEHYTVSNGVHGVQEKLSKGIRTRLSTRVLAVKPQDIRIKVYWKLSGDCAKADPFEDSFDRVILAVPPDVVAKIFAPLSYEMSGIPTTPVESVAHHVPSKAGGVFLEAIAKGSHSRRRFDTGPAQMIHLRTSVDGAHRTESAHEQPSGVTVTNCPLTTVPSSESIRSVKFTRVLRTPESREIVNSIFGEHLASSWTRRHGSGWRNGDGGVWLAGGWCWDGLVLLEGCEVSAMRIADAFGVDVPWRVAK
jgi:Flavin containing amine oxidoreductase